jgi:murein DD-endopeptidase MepM/ murein hydrolase activator NlpD
VGRRTTDLLAICLVGIVIGSIHDAPVREASPAPPAAVPSRPIAPAPPPTLAQASIAGWIIDGAGVPIEGVAIALHDPTAAAAEVIATSEADGSFRTDRLTQDAKVLLDAPHVFPAEVAWRSGDSPPRIMLALRVEIAARVTAGAKPVVGAEVQITDGSGPTLATAITDDAGYARFGDLVAGPYEVWARRGTSVSPLVRLDVAGPSAEVELALAPGGTVGGHVSAAGARVLLVPVDVEHAARVTTVDGVGRFAIAGLPFGRWRAEVDAPEHVRSTEHVVAITAEQPEAELVVRLDPAGVVRGVVVGPDGTPIPNATIVLRAKDSPQAGPLMPVEPAPARLRWVHPLAGERQLPIREIRRFGAYRAGVRPSECGRGHCGNDLGGTRGVVVHAAADGEVIGAFTEIRKEAGRYVAIMHAGGLVTFYMHLDELRAGLAIGDVVRAGDPIGTVGSTGFGKLNPHLHFALAQERLGRRLFVDPEPILRHAVVLPVARPLAPSEPVVIASIRGVGATATAPPRMATDADGRFRIAGVTPGTYVATAFDADLAPGVSPEFRVTGAAETADVTIKLVAGVVVHGRVFGRDSPIPGARIVVEEGSGETVRQVATAYTGYDGAFALRSLSGTVTVTVGAVGYGEVERVLTLGTAGDRRREDFDLVGEDARLVGQVLGPDGTPAIAAVTIVRGPTQHRRIDTDATGNFVIDRVARGSYVVELSSAEYPSTRATLVADTWRELRLAQGGSLSIEVYDAHTGRALPGVVVEASGPDRIVRPVTDLAGAATARALEPGTWSLRVPVPGYVTAVQSVQVRAVAATQKVRIELSRGATLAGVVRDRHGERAPGARVWSGGAETRADKNGEFRLVDVPTGAVRIEAELDAARGAVAVELAPGDERVTLVIDLAE